MGWGAFRHAGKEVDVMSGATIQLNFTSLDELKGELPRGKIGSHEISRLIAGGNLVGGWAHSRDLRYVSSLFKAYIRKQGYTAGLAAHTVDALIACDAYGLVPDYYMKAMHHDNYWSAHPRENRVPFEVDGEKYLDHNKFHDNCFCLFPDRTAEFVERATVPVMGFKVLAAGAIEPSDGFNWAFENGADFICVGMFDFQVVEDVNTTIDVLHKLQGRTRPWYG